MTTLMTGIRWSSTRLVSIEAVAAMGVIKVEMAWYARCCFERSKFSLYSQSEEFCSPTG